MRPRGKSRGAKRATKLDKKKRDDAISRTLKKLDKLGTTPIGYTACWKDTPTGHCRKPKDHDGDCIGA